ncbi:MAG: hypothetical protein Q4D72_10720, partial [Capnocytophaga sp.]|nr:hypothetical protein [Capnocytophaga sp.]
SQEEGAKDLARTIAHELGHGIFKLEHPFKKDETKKGTFRTLMDYAQETAFAHSDWKQINDPKLKIYVFQEQDDGEYKIKELDYVCVFPEIPIPHILKDLDNQNIILGKEYRAYAFVGSKTKKYKGRVAIIQHIPSKKLYFPLQSKYGEDRQGYMAFDTDNNQTILFKDFTLSNKKGNLVYATDFCEYYVNDKKVKRIVKCRDCNGLPQRDEQNHKFFIDEKLLILPDYFSVEASNENEIKENMRIIIDADRRGQRADKQDLSYGYNLLPSTEKAQDIYKTVVTLWNNYENFFYKNHLNPSSYHTAGYYVFENEKKKLDNKKLLMPELIRDNALRNVSENFIKEFFKNKIKGYMNLTDRLMSTYLWNENQRAKYEKAGEDLVNHFYKKTGENYYATKTISEAIYETENGKRRIDNMIKLINHIFMYEINNDEVIQKNPLDDSWFTNRININCFPGFEAKYLYNKVFSDELENKERLGNNERLALFCIGGTQGAKVGVKEWKKITQNDKIGYEATVVLEYFDTFGVSENDYTKDLGFWGNKINLAKYNYRGGVLAQWILQHQYGYQPFKDHLTYIIKIKHLWKK